MSAIPALAPKFRLNLIQGDDYTIRMTARRQSDQSLIDLTGYKAALQVRKAYGESALLTLATSGYSDFTSSSGCSITLGGAAGTIDLTFGHAALTALSTAQFTATTADDGSVSYTGLFDLELVDGSGNIQKYARGTAVLVQQVTEP